jgi:hypothetical protein
MISRNGAMIEKSLITREEFMEKISEEGATYWKLLTLPDNKHTANRALVLTGMYFVMG